MTAIIVCTLAFGGCLTTNPSVVADTDNSTVFESFAVSEPWANQKVRAEATLASTPPAKNVTTITVVRPNGKIFSTQQVGPGQTSVVLPLPTNQRATLVASNSVNSTTIEKLNVTTTGNEII